MEGLETWGICSGSVFFLENISPNTITHTHSHITRNTPVEVINNFTVGFL